MRQPLDPERIGGKAVGLFQLPEEWVPRFVVLTQAFQERLKRTKTALTTLHQLPDEDRELIEEFLRTASPEGGLPRRILIRSNSTMENLLLRGAYKSYVAPPTDEAIAEGIALVLESPSTEAMCVILQAAIEPGLLGHMSNERRITPNKKRWLIEGLSPDEEIHQQFVRAGGAGRADPLFARTEKDVANVLRRVAGKLGQVRSGRFHCEWVWNGKRLWIVQSDEAISPTPITAANDYLQSTENAPPTFFPKSEIKHFRDVTSDQWRKLKRPKQFDQLDFPVADVFLLTGDKWTSPNPARRKTLLHDLAAMCTNPVVVRFDISKQVPFEDTFLPTSPALTDPKELARYMDEQVDSFREKGLKDSDWGFLLANLVPARACAMIHAHPKAQRIRIDALWGFPDGLLHFPHDSWFYYPDGRVTEHRRYKSQCLLPKGSGWIQTDVGPPLDWAAVLSSDEAATLGKWGLSLANSLGSEVQLMALARIGGRRGADACLPWHYTNWNVPQYSESLQVLPTLSQVGVVRFPSDLDSLSQNVASRGMRGYLVRPAELYLRDDEFLKACARFAAAQHKPIYFEGSLLAHAYYMMARTGAVVIPITGDEPKRDKKQYFKLVRDRIPIVIQKAGGLARVRHVPRSEANAMLAQKLIEEAFEVRGALQEGLIEELADVLEVVDTLRSHAGIDKERLERLREEKRAKRGGFDQLIYLEETGVQSLKVQRDAEGHLPLFSDDASLPSNKGRPKEKRIQLKPTHDPGELVRFDVSLIPPVERVGGQQHMEVEVAGFHIEVNYGKNNATVSVARERRRESPNQLVLFTEMANAVTEK
ncbi:MAG: nucleoside triphosphate pyrophosphohydrolase [Verrucomicrobia bacterium]|nr:nucleoside triphosphate pyrophosphohydrolase [Verrucomicrobiota bacterium]